MDLSSDLKSDIRSDSESDYESDSDFGANLEPPSDILPLEPSSRTSTPQHSIGARIQAVTFLELNIPHFKITAKTGISKA
jgi:hypothetical protein